MARTTKSFRLAPSFFIEIFVVEASEIAIKQELLILAFYTEVDCPAF